MRGARAAALALGVALGAAAAAAAQEPSAGGVATPARVPSSPTAIRLFLEQRGVLVVEQLQPLPPVPLDGGGALRVAAAFAYEPGLENQRLLGVRVDCPAAPDPAAGEPRVYLDLHEVEALLRAMALMEGLARDGGESEARFRSQEGLGVAVAGPSYEVSCGDDGAPRTGLGAAGFDALRTRLEQARERLFSPAPR